MALAAVDRLVHHATILEIEAESYRRKQAMNASKPVKKNEAEANSSSSLI